MTGPFSNIREGWEDFRAEVLKEFPNVPPAGYEVTFYAGATTMLGVLSDAAKGGRNLAHAVVALEAEVNAFVASKRHQVGE
jgi:hypothetical protein